MKITKHAFEQMEKRGFTVEMLARLLKGRQKIQQSLNDKNRYLITGFVDGNWWTLVVEKDEMILPWLKIIIPRGNWKRLKMR